MSDRLEFRVPISPTVSFYRRTHLFCAALRRLGPPYKDALVRVTVGDEAEIAEVIAANPWAADYPMEWHPVPAGIFREHHYFGTADYRYLLPAFRDGLVILMDADALVVKPFHEELAWMQDEAPAIAGHMAHSSPPVKRAGEKVRGEEIWPFLFREFGIPWPEKLYPYSIGAGLAPVPAYFNLGFIALNRAALEIFRENIFETQRRLKSMIESEMRCQIACTLIAHAHRFRIVNLPATFNAANDSRHVAQNKVELDDIRVIHYLREAELSRESFLSWESREAFLGLELKDPVNRLLQNVIRELRDL
jgi:hypothetical protein